MDEVKLDGGVPRYYFHEANNMLLDVDKGVFKYDVSTCTMVLIAPLRKRERNVLTCLLARENTLVLRADILAKAWQGRVVSERIVTVSVYQLRKLLALLDPDCRCLETVNKLGYVFLPKKSNLMPVRSLSFLLASLRWRDCTSLPTSQSHYPVERAHVRDLDNVKW